MGNRVARCLRSKVHSGQLVVEFESLPVGDRCIYYEFSTWTFVVLNENAMMGDLVEVMMNLPVGTKCTIL
jgi:hypothetical protein